MGSPKPHHEGGSGLGRTLETRICNVHLATLEMEEGSCVHREGHTKLAEGVNGGEVREGVNQVLSTRR